MKKILISVISFIFIGIIFFWFRQYYAFTTQSPSAEWSKGIDISSGNINNVPKIIKLNDNYVISHDDGDKIKLMVVDSMGIKVNEKVLESGDEFVKDVNLLTDDQFIYLNWIIESSNTQNIMHVKINEKLEVIEKWETHDVTESTQVGDNVLVIADRKGIEINDIKKKQKAYFPVKSPDELSGTITKDGYLIAYRENYYIHKFFIFNDGKIVREKAILARRGYGTNSSSELILNSAVACDDKKGYLLIESRVGKEYGINTIIEFPLDGGVPNLMKGFVGDGKDKKTVYYDAGNGISRNLSLLPQDQLMYNPVAVSSGGEARFLIGYAREYGVSERQFDILDFSLKDGKVSAYSFAENTRQATTLANICDNVLIYCQLVKYPDKYNLCMASRDEAFKNYYNKPRPSELKTALLNTVSDLMNSIFSVFLIGIRWILPIVILASIFTLFGYKFSNARKKAAFIVICILAAILKTYFAYNTLYGQYVFLLPETLKSVRVGLLILVSISLLAYSYGYIKYTRDARDNPDTMPILSFSLGLFIDSLLTLMVYSPYII